MNRLVTLAVVLAATAHGAHGQTRSPEERVLYVTIGCPSSQARLLQGKSDAMRDIAKGTFTKRRVIGAHPMPLNPSEWQRIQLEEQVWKRLGVAVTFDKAPDVLECWNPPYLEGYDSEVDKHLRAKFGEDYVAQVEREVNRKLRLRPPTPKPQ